MHPSEPEREQVPGAVANRACPANPGGHESAGLEAKVLRLQRSAGNRAALAWLHGRTVARAPGDPRAVAVENSSPAQADRMTLADFNGLTERQADWADEPKFRAAPVVTEELRTVVEMAQEFGKEFLSAAGDLNMKDLRVAARHEKQKLRHYGLALSKFGWTPAKTVAAAVAWGDAVPKLESALTTDVMRQTIKQGPEGTNVSDLVKAKAVDDFVEFVNTTKPLLSAANGAEVRSFLALRAEGDWRKYAGQVGPVRSIHHFSKGALDRLKKNVSDISRKKPLAVVLHTSVDHNGAFHRDPNIAQVAGAPQSTTILIEGATSLVNAGQTLSAVVKHYGQGTPPKARQIMLAGHGNSRVTELAGDRGNDGKVKTEDVDLDANSTESLKLIKVLLDNLEAVPASQVVLNGCLTASASVVTAPPAGAGAADQKKALEEMKKLLKAKRSLADTIRDLAAARGMSAGQVSASNSSFGNEVSLIDPATGRLGLRSGFDPLLTSADKFAYLAKAGEATGAGRALVEAVIADPVKAAAAAKKRLAGSTARTTWDDRVIKALYREALADMNDIVFINQAAALAGGMSEIQFADQARPFQLSDATVDVLDRMFKRVEKDPQFKDQKPPLMRVVAYEVWMLAKADKRASFLAALGQMTAQDAAPLVDLDLVNPQLSALLPDPPSANAAGELRLALLDVTRTDGAPDPASIAYLRRRRVGARFAEPQKITTALGGKSSASAVLEVIKEPQPAGPPAAGQTAPPAPSFNVDLDQDGTNDAYVEPLVKDGLYTTRKGNGPAQDVHQKPAAGSAVIGKLPDGTAVHVIGRSGSWYCIEFGADKRPAFVDDLLVSG